MASALVPVVEGRWSDPSPAGALGKVKRDVLGQVAPPDLTGLDLLQMDIRPQRVVAPLPNGRQAELTLDPALQRAALTQMERFRIPEAGAVLMDVRSGNLLVYASYVNQGGAFDVNSRATAPAASIFKLITGAALIEQAQLNADTQQCYHGGRSRISAEDLIDNPQKDKWCASLGDAMGRSINVVFGRLAQKHLKPEDLTRMAGAFGFGAPVPFPVKNDVPAAEIPGEPLEFARTAAGFWHTALSPLAAVGIAQSIASSGVTIQPRIVAKVLEAGRTTWEDGTKPKVLRRAVKPSTAAELSRMMTSTVTNGSARAAFADRRGNPYLPGISVAAKTGTLTAHQAERHYTWLVAFAPVESPEVALSVLVVNTPSWQIKAPTLARDILRAYFAKAGRAGVTPP